MTKTNELLETLGIGESTNRALVIAAVSRVKGMKLTQSTDDSGETIFTLQAK
jgi:hypothetical protein